MLTWAVMIVGWVWLWRAPHFRLVGLGAVLIFAWIFGLAIYAAGASADMRAAIGAPPREIGALALSSTFWTVIWSAVAALVVWLAKRSRRYEK